jgi:peroxiredoxin
MGRVLRLLCAVLGAVPVACGGTGGERPAPYAQLEIGSPAPAYAARGLAGDSMAFGGSSTEVTLLNVWATWCTSCREEFAELERLRTSHEARGLKVVAVSVDQGGDEKVRRFVDAQGTRFPVAHDREARISGLYGVVGLPATYLIGRDGRIRWTLTGSFLPALGTLERAIEAELGESR